MPHRDVIDHVLTPFPDELVPEYEDGLKDAAKAVLGCLKLGVDTGMNRFNPKKKKKAQKEQDLPKQPE